MRVYCWQAHLVKTGHFSRYNHPHILCMCSKGLYNNYLEGGLENYGWWAQEKITTRERGCGCKVNTYKGGITFSFLFANWKSSGRVNRVQI